MSGDAAGVAVLVIDDNDTNLQILTGLLSAQGMEVSTARDGADARRVAAQCRGPFALIVVDEMLTDATAPKSSPHCGSSRRAPPPRRWS